MDFTVILAFGSGLLAVALALTVAWHERRSLAHWAFGTGMVLLAAESVFSGLAADSVLPEEVIYWQNWRLFIMAFLPSTWLFLSLTYARGNVREFLATW